MSILLRPPAMGEAKTALAAMRQRLVAVDGWKWEANYEVIEKALSNGWLDRLELAAYYYRRSLKEIIADCGHDEPDIDKIRKHAKQAISAADFELTRGSPA